MVAAMFFVHASSAMAALAIWALFGVVLGGGITAAITLLRRVVPVCMLLVVLNGALLPGESILAWHGHDLLSRIGLERGLFYALRLLAMVCALAATLALVRPEGIARGIFVMMRRFSSAFAARLALHGYLAVSFLPLMRAEFDRVREAQDFRGVAIRRGPFARIVQIPSIIVPLILSSIRRAGHLAASIRLRRIEERIGSDIVLPRPRVRDAAVLVATCVIVAIGATMGRA